MDFTSENIHELSDRELVIQFFKCQKSEVTTQGYFKSLSYVLSFDRADYEASITKIADFLAFARLNKGIAEFRLKDWILKNKNTMAGATLRGYLAAVKSLLEYSNVLLNWKQISKVCPRARRSAEVDATPIEATRKLFKICDIREKFLVSLFVSSGIRLGALDYLKVKDLREFEIDGQTIGILSVYTGEVEAYEAFVSTECLSLWKEYKADRERQGEKLTGDSPLIRNIIGIIERKRKRIRKTELIRPLSSNSVRDLFSILWIKAGYPSRTWKEVHGWRSAFKTSLESAGVKTIRIEKLIGHAEGLQHSYDRPLLEELARDYIRAQNSLSIDEALIAKHEVQTIKDTTQKEMRDYKVDLVLANQRMAEMEKTQGALFDQVKMLVQRIDAQYKKENPPYELNEKI